MSRPSRFSYMHAVHHATLRCNNREFLFNVPSFELFLDTLQKTREKFSVKLYNYCLMTNHVHLLFKVPDATTLSPAMHWLSTSFSRRFNKFRQRNGHLWEGRFRSTIIEEDSYFFRCMAYIDLNPVRAKMAASPLEYTWSGHRALRDEDPAVLDFHTLYLHEGRTAKERYKSYLSILEEEIKRPPIPLANQYFVGRWRFVSRMATRFRCGRRTTASDISGGVIGIRLKVGGPRLPALCKPTL